MSLDPELASRDDGRVNPAELEIREARLLDAGDVATLERACFGDDALPMITIVQYLELFARSSLVATRSGTCVGMLIAGASSDDPHTAWILDVAVHPSARAGGIASRMLRDALRIMRERGALTALTTVSPGNEASLALFRRMGFAIERTEPAYFGAGAARHILRLELSASDAGRMA